MIVNSQGSIFSSQHGCFLDYGVKHWKAMEDSQFFGEMPQRSQNFPPSLTLIRLNKVNIEKTLQ